MMPHLHGIQQVQLNHQDVLHASVDVFFWSGYPFAFLRSTTYFSACSLCRLNLCLSLLILLYYYCLVHSAFENPVDFSIMLCVFCIQCFLSMWALLGIYSFVMHFIEMRSSINSERCEDAIWIAESCIMWWLTLFNFDMFSFASLMAASQSPWG